MDNIKKTNINIKKASINITKSYISTIALTKKQCDDCCGIIKPGTEYCPYCYSNIYTQIAKQIIEENPKIFTDSRDLLAV